MLVLVIGARRAVALVTDLSEGAKSVIQVVVALGGYAFGVYRWWLYREKVLFERLDEHLLTADRSLRYSRSKLFEVSMRPNVGAAIVPPLVDGGSFIRVLESQNWMTRFATTPRDVAVDSDLSRTTIQLHEQRALRLRQHEQFDQILATAHLLRGALDSHRARMSTEPAAKRQFAQRAVQHFEDAMRLPGNLQDVDAVELKGLELISINEIDAAKAVFEELERRVRLLPLGRNLSIRLARAFKYQAMVRLGQQGQRKRVVQLLELALQEMGPYAPFTGRELLDQALLYELLSIGWRDLQAWNNARLNGEEARNAFRQLEMTTRCSSVFGVMGRSFRRQLGEASELDNLHAAAIAGLQRILVEEAQLSRKKRNKSSQQSQNSAANATPPV